MTEHEEYMEYQQTGILEAYRPEDMRTKIFGSGKVIPVYPDMGLCSEPGAMGFTHEIVVGGRLFRVHSLFSMDAQKTPTEAMLRVIDSDLEKESYSG